MSKHLFNDPSADYVDYTFIRQLNETDKMLSLRIKIKLDLDEILNGQCDELRFKEYCKDAIIKSQDAANIIRKIVEETYPSYLNFLEKYLILK